ncbi:bifunctional metallophosphatase/5'-nucleotidase [Ferrimonas aestuarii]|uniref:Bifunctional metallophosphatase/5'-nucleotidase n=1 Tax=Ferrimonas aestuarii TaxID=2569539 RepID=A0A4V5NVA3_9GAMM|nr:5'-nucleotidase C-terminal domain-containing protein [Ferrimonas aestuarii]TKB49652.1 bifunctional metallophosphatase/5'-nucleotidase [Ferrimonas aestuarii]
MKITKRSLLCLSIIAALSGCSDDDTVYVDVPSDYSPVVMEGKTLTNTNDIVVKSANEVDELTITVGATSDLHGRIFGYDYALDSEDKDAGLTRIETLLKQERTKNPNIILVDIGDTVQGNSAQLFNDDPTHPVVLSLNSMGFDAWIPGNHEFNFERSFIDRNLDHFNGAVLSSNIKWESNDVNYIRGYQVFEVDGAKVAIVGLTPSNVPNWEASAPSHFKGLKFEEELAATQAAVDELIEKFQPDVIVGALHLGRSGEAGAGVYNIASAMADKFDVILAGHEHATYIENVEKGSDTSTDISVGGGNTVEDKTLSGVYDEAARANNVKIMEPGKWGSNLALAEIELKKVDGKWTMVDTTLSNLSTKEVTQDADLSAEFQYVDDTSKADARTPLGTVNGNFTPSFDGSGGADEAVAQNYNQDAGRLYSTIHTAKVIDTPLMDFINQVQIEKSGATVSAASLFSDASNLTDGQSYTKGTSTSLYKYDNTLLGVNMSGKNLKRFMEWSYTYFNEYKAGDLTVSFKKGSPAYLYDQFDGNFKYTVDLSKPALEMDADYKVTNEGERITITEINGEAFDLNATYKVALNSYRWGSQIKKYGWGVDADVYYDSVNEQTYAIRDMLTEYVGENAGVAAADFTNPNWEFVQYAADGAITQLRNDGGAGEALWNKLRNMEVCVKIDEDNPKYPAIVTSVNVNDATTYFTNPNASAASDLEKYQGCSPAH